MTLTIIKSYFYESILLLQVTSWKTIAKVSEKEVR